MITFNNIEKSFDYTIEVLAKYIEAEKIEELEAIKNDFLDNLEEERRDIFDQDYLEDIIFSLIDVDMKEVLKEKYSRWYNQVFNIVNHS
jgi:hypothetical protein